MTPPQPARPRQESPSTGIDTAIVIPVHNRCAVTLGCIRRLVSEGVFSWAHVMVVDDGSSDGTATEIAARFPDVELLRGNGQLWWTGAIALGMEAALARGADYIMWLNDDCTPIPGALRRLRDVSAQRSALVGGTCVLPGDEITIYGGLKRNGFAFDLVPYRSGGIESCDALSGNLVCMPARLVRAIGLPDARGLPHAIGDLDYGLRAGRAGWPVLVVHDAKAEAVPNTWDNHASWLLGHIAVLEIWRSAWRKRSYGYFPTQWVFFRRYWGWRGGVHALWLLAKRVPILLIRLMVPQAWLRKIWSRRSSVWQEEQRLRKALAAAQARASTVSLPIDPEKSRS